MAPYIGPEDGTPATRDRWMAGLIWMAIDQGWSMGGMKIKAACPNPKGANPAEAAPGDYVEITVHSGGPLESSWYVGASGYLVGFTVNAGFAIVDIGTCEVSVHPENLKMIRKNPASYDITYPGSVKRWVITHVAEVSAGPTRGMRVLTLSAQGRYSYETEQEANAALDEMRPGMPNILTAREVDSLKVVPCPCWPGHFDPCRTVFSGSLTVDL